MKHFIATFILSFTCLLMLFAQSGVPAQMSYQGYLTDNSGTPQMRMMLLK